ncbi:MAG TPA: MipA/OmpV family protein [Gammaproteobacteria bacterium]|nr:MipA/OmpV family protein [Gammaproteobacteria bacterium]
MVALAADPGPRPSLELGVGVGALRFPDYPGAEEQRTLALPFPYFVFHSKYLDVNRDRVRGKLLAGDRLSLDVDFGGSVAVDSSRDRERAGMPDLDWIGEAGPALRYRIWESDGGDTRLEGVLPVRKAVSVHVLEFHDRGWTFAPRVEIGHRIGSDDRYLGVDAGLSVLRADQKYYDYIYGVAPQYATATRPAYTPDGGYGGYTLSLGMSLRRDDVVYGAFFRYTDLDGAVFAASPLVSRLHEVSFGVAVSWILKTEYSED